MRPDSFTRFSPVRAFRRVMRARSVTSYQIDTDSFVLEGFGDELTTYTFTLDDISLEGDEAVVTVTLTRNGDSAIIDDTLTELFIDGERVDFNDGADPQPSEFGGLELTLRGPASGGEQVRVDISTEQFGGASASLTGTVPEGGPAPIQAGDLEIRTFRADPTEIVAGDDLFVSIELACIRDDPCPAVDVEWYINGALFTTQTADFTATTDRELNVEMPGTGRVGEYQFDEPGTYTIEARVPGDSASGTVTVEQPAEAEIVITNINPPFDPVVGDSVAAAVRAENTGDAAGTRTVDALLNGTVVDTLSFDIDAGGTQSRSAFFTVEQAGENSLMVGEQTVTFQVSEPEPEPEPANIVVQDIMPPAQPAVGKDVSATIVAENTGGEMGSRTVDVLLDGNRIGSVTFNLDPGQSQGRGVGFTIQSAGSKTLRAGDQQATFEVPEPEPEFDPGAVAVPADECTVTPQDVEPPEDVELSATVRNDNDIPAAATVEWTWAGEQLATAAVDVPQNAGEVATAPATIDREGQGQVRAEVISASESAASSVRAPATEPVRAGASNEDFH